MLSGLGHIYSLCVYFCPDYHPYIFCSLKIIPTLWGGGGAAIVHPSSHWARDMDTPWTAHQSHSGHAFHSNLSSPVNLPLMFLDGGKKQEYLKKIMEAWAGNEPQTFLLCGNRANHCSTTPPTVIHIYNCCLGHKMILGALFLTMVHVLTFKKKCQWSSCLCHFWSFMPTFHYWQTINLILQILTS